MKSEQLHNLIDHTHPDSVFDEIKNIYNYHYTSESFSDVERIFILIKTLFRGDFEGYRACNTEYHDMNHTIDTLLATARLIDGYNIENQNKPLDEDTAKKLMKAALLHDTGYIQEEWDSSGTGAKYSLSHVERSVSFIKKNCQKLGFTEDEAIKTERLVMYTGISEDLEKLDYDDKNERLAGSLLATADLMGQMADRVYLEKLIFLYRELKEAGIGDYKSEFDIIRKTISFYQFVMERLNGPCFRVYKLAQSHFRERFSIDSNLYMDSIRRHIAYLYWICDDNSVNFRHKLKRNVNTFVA